LVYKKSLHLKNDEDPSWHISLKARDNTAWRSTERRRTTMFARMCRSSALAVSGVLLLAWVRPAAASWQRTELPGMTSGKSIAITAGAIGGGVVAGYLLYKKFRGGAAASRLEVPQSLKIVGCEHKALGVL
jgi:hypothetical protein